jgi:phage-related protein
MYTIEFFKDGKGNRPIVDYIKGLREAAATDKNARINFNKIVAYMDLLCEHGTRIGEPVTKHLKGDIWELRPLDNRILYAYYKDNKFIMLHHFIKKTQKLPPRELEQAKRNLAEHIEREGK